MTRAKITGSRIQHIELREIHLVRDDEDTSRWMDEIDNHDETASEFRRYTDGLKGHIREWLASVRFRLGYRAYWAENFDRAHHWLQPLADHNDCAAQYYIGRMHSRGEGVSQDMAQALRWWNASAGRGERWAQVEIGNLYETGSGVPQSFEKARKWYQRAADAGLAEAQVRIGYFHDAGLGGIPVNHLVARQWYLRAAVQGEKNAYHNLAVHYANGLGIPADKQKALVWLNKARPHETVDTDDLHVI